MPNQDYDPACNYCPNCGDEYRPEIKYCADCELGLISGAEMQARVKPPHSAGECPQIDPSEGLAVVRQGPLAYVKELHAYLRQQGLPSLIAPQEGNACAGSCRGPQLTLQVRQQDLVAVNAALDAQFRHSTGMEDDDPFTRPLFDPEVEQAVCPACGCLFSPKALLCPDCGLRFA